MIWFFFALLAPFAWAVINHIDKYLISRYLRRKSPMVLVIISSLIGIVIAPLIGAFSWSSILISPDEILLFIFSGILFVCSLIPYFYALEKDETSLVVPLFQMVPVVSTLLGYVFLRETLTYVQVGASLLIILGGLGLGAKRHRSRVKFQWDIFFLILTSSTFLSLDAIMFKYAAINTHFWPGAFWKYVGFIIPGIIILIAFPSYRGQFIQTITVNKAFILSLNFINELINAVAVFAYNFASLFISVGLVFVVVEGFQPFFVLILGILLTIFFPKIAKENISQHVLRNKVFFLLMMFVGTVILLK